MARTAHSQPAKTGQAKPPISAHPMFPVIVALWFGALFGLGSLAIRPSVIESAVLSSHLDVIIPAAAPPLGTTWRILMALVLALIGGGLGALIARRIARPKAELRERKRGASFGTASQAAKVAPARKPISAHSEFGDAQEGFGSGRRRALAMDEDTTPNYHQEFAPLPGGDTQIFDINAYDLETSDDGYTATESADALDLGGFLDAEPAAQSSYEAPASHEAPVETDMTDQANFHNFGSQNFEDNSGYGAHEDASEAPFSFEATPIRFPVAEPAAQFAAPEPAQTFSAPEAPFQSHQSFAPPQQNFAPAVPDAAAPAFAPPAFAEPVAAAPEFPRFGAPQAFDPAPEPVSAPAFAAPVDAVPEFPRFGAPQSYEAAPVTEQAQAEPVMATAAPEPAHVPQAAEQPAETVDLSDLSHVELIGRLQRSLGKRRAQSAAASPLAVPAIPTAFVPEAIAPEAAAPVVPAFSVPSFTVPASDLPRFDLPAAAPMQFSAPEPEVAFEALPVFASPASFAPLEAEAAPIPAAYEASPAPVALAPSPMAAVPAAMRPLSFDDHHDDEGDFISHIPPRHIAMPAQQALAATYGMPAAQEDEQEETAAGDEEGDKLSDGYSSLLDLSRPVEARPSPLETRQSFVRVEEPVSDSDSVEPVVVFPGQAARFDAPAQTHLAPSTSDFRPFAQPQPVAVVEEPAVYLEPGIRHFDAPASDTPSPVVIPASFQPIPPPAQDAEETERALRSALANLQRMSGAA